MIARTLLGAMMVSTALPAHAAWLEARTNNFVVLADEKETEIRDLATHLERFDQALRTMRGMDAVTKARSNPITVFVVSGVAEVQQLCRSGSKRSACANVYGFYAGSAEGSAAFTPRRSGSGSKFDLSAEQVLFHEYAHHFMLENWAAAYPAWFVEGFAEFNSTVTFEKDGSVGLGLVPLYRAYGLATGTALPLATMLAADRPLKTEEERGALYEQGWLLTHYLTFTKARAGQLNTYLKSINRGMRGMQAAQAAFGDVTALDRETNAYLQSRTIRYLRVTPNPAPIAVTIRALPPGEVIMMPVRLRSDRGVNRAAAIKLVADARRLAAAFPKDAAVQVTLAEAEYDAGFDDLAEAAADRALATDPRSGGAMLYKGKSQVRRLSAAKSTDGKAWSAARKWYIGANAIDNDNAAALMLFYDSFIQEGRKPTSNAVNALARAFELVPQDDSLRWKLVQCYAEDGRLADARDVLAPLAFNPHAPADNPYAAMLAALDTGNAADVRSAVKAANEAKPAESER